MNALLLVDLQLDFMPGGALAVAGGDQLVALANRLQPRFELVLASQDWHPADHGSFASQHAGRQPGERIELDGVEQVLWPDHCVQGSAGAGFHPELDFDRVARIFQKGLDPRVDSYSAFFDNARRHDTGLTGYLRQRGVTRLHCMGLATDYCVKFTVLDALDQGFETHLVVDGCRAVELSPGDGLRAVDALAARGARIVRSSELT